MLSIASEDLPIYRLLVDENSEFNFISIVSDPAFEVMGMFFSSEKNSNDNSRYMFKRSIEDEMTIIGPAIIPDVLIFRKGDDKRGPHYTFFKKEDIENLVKIFNSSSSNRKINFDHSKTIIDAYIMESWIIEDEIHDKSKLYNFDLPVGTFMVKVKIDDELFWDDFVKNKGFYGFSIECLTKMLLQSDISSLSLSKDIGSNDYLDILNNLTDSELLYLYKNL